MTATFATVTAGTIVLSSREYADALFTASLACGCIPPESQVMETIKTTIVRHGLGYCAATVAGEFGEHPEVAVARMRRVRDLVAGLPVMTIEL